VTTAERTELVEIERQRLRALVEGDLGQADALHAEDFQLVTPGGSTYTKAEYLGDIASGEVDYLVWEAGDIDVRVCGDAACLRYLSLLDIVVAGRAMAPGHYWHTDYYERRAGRWQVVWSHATKAASRAPA
jgi:hypothetical protein